MINDSYSETLAAAVNPYAKWRKPLLEAGITLYYEMRLLSPQAEKI
jgi:hypothetical protein